MSVVLRRPQPIRRRRRLIPSVVAAPSDAIACTDLTAGRVYQRVAGGTTKTITFSGTYTGTAPTTVEVKLVKQSDSSMVQDWTALGSTTIAGGNWSGTLSVPQSGYWLNFLARGKNGGGSVLATSSQTSNKWGVGIIVAMIGQSNMASMDSVSSPPSSSDLTRQYTTAGGWELVVGNGKIRLANLLQSGTSLLIATMNFAVGGTNIGGSQGWSTSNSNVWTAFLTGLTAVGGDVELFLWHQGEADAISGTSKSSYKTGMDSLYANCQSATGRNTTTLKFGCAILGNIDDPTATDATTDAIRQAQLEWIPATTGAFYAGSSVDMVRLDAYHWSVPYYERMARRYAQAVLFQMGLVAFGAGGPQIASASRVLGQRELRLVVTQDAGTDLKDASGSTAGASLTGFDASIDDFSTLLTISSTVFVYNAILLELSAAPADGDTVKVRYQYGETVVVTNPVYDDTTPQSDTIGLPLRPTTGSVTCSTSGGGTGGVSGSRIFGGF